MALSLGARQRRWLGGVTLSLVGGGPAFIPLAYLGWLALAPGPAAFARALVESEAPVLAARTLLLAAGTVVWAALLAIPLAWLLVRTDLPGRRVFLWLAPLPLAVPPYVGALCYASLLGLGGIVESAVGRRLGLPIYGPVGAAFVLGTFTYPYLFLVVRGTLERANPALEEAARGLGLRPGVVLLKVTLALLRPALTGGALLVFVYALVDFGVVSLLRVRTFTTVVYTYLLAGFSLSAAAALALALVVLIWVALGVQQRALGTARYTQVSTTLRPPPLTTLGAWRWPALAYVAAVLAMALLLPIGVLLGQVGRLGGAAVLDFWLHQAEYARNTLAVALSGATTATLLATILAWPRGRVPGLRLASLALQAGYAVPGTVLGLALVGLYIQFVPAVHGTAWGVALAYGVLYAAPAHQAARAALGQVSPTIEEAARGLGLGAFRTFLAVTMPIAWPGILGGWMLVLILAMRELAATLILRPPGFDTLSVRIWVHTMDVGPDPQAAAVALLLIAMIGLLWGCLLRLRPGELSPIL